MGSRSQSGSRTHLGHTPPLQFFVSELSGVKSPIQNRVSQALFERIEIAITNREDFKVYILTNAHPEGNVDGAATKMVTSYVS